MNFQKNIKNLRKNYNISQEELALRLGISRSSVANYENGQNFPNMDILLKMSKIFNCTIDYLLGRSQFKNYKEFEQALKHVGAILDFCDEKTKQIIISILNSIQNSYYIEDVDKYVTDILTQYNLTYEDFKNLKIAIIALYELWQSIRKEKYKNYGFYYQL